nr:uncharacterized protein LOC129463779 [Symphalangus syndactylus]
MFSSVTDLYPLDPTAKSFLTCQMSPGRQNHPLCCNVQPTFPSDCSSPTRVSTRTAASGLSPRQKSPPSCCTQGLKGWRSGGEGEDVSTSGRAPQRRDCPPCGRRRSCYCGGEEGRGRWLLSPPCCAACCGGITLRKETGLRVAAPWSARAWWGAAGSWGDPRRWERVGLPKPAGVPWTLSAGAAFTAGPRRASVVRSPKASVEPKLPQSACSQRVITHGAAPPCLPRAHLRGQGLFLQDSGVFLLSSLPDLLTGLWMDWEVNLKCEEKKNRSPSQ